MYTEGGWVVEGDTECRGAEYCEGFGGAGGQIAPAQSAFVEESHPRHERASHQTLLHRKRLGTANVSLHRERFTPQKFRGTANVSLHHERFTPQKFRGTANVSLHRERFTPQKFRGTANVSLHRNTFATATLSLRKLSLRTYRKLFSRRQAGLGPPGSSLWPVARAAQRMMSATVKRLREQWGVVHPEMNRVPRTM